MMKKGLALLLVLAMALGTLAITATAENTDAVDYRVGYSKVDLNPYWSIWQATGGTIPTELENYAVDQNGNPIGSDHMMPLPMGGYGGNTHRLSRPELIDDNGSGVHADDVVYLRSNRYTEAFAKEMLGDGTDAYKQYAEGGFGDNDGDGIYATCIAIKQNENAEPVLMFSVDLISVAETYAGQAKNVIIRELKKAGIHISPNRILINATHTHGAVALGESFTSTETYNQKLWGNEKTVPFSGEQLEKYLNTYRKHLYAQLADAAVKALSDGQNSGSVVMEKGTVDASDVTGYTLNGVRHRKAQLTTTVDGTSQTVDYVTGSSFNVDLDGEKEISGVSESDDKLHVLEFTFPDADAEPILLINWRAHTTANNKMNTKAHNNLSADFVAAMRYRLEQWGYRPILNYGASGNLGMGDVPSTANISTAATSTTMNATKYGYALAMAAAYLADGTSNSAVKAAYDENRAALDTKRQTAATDRATADANASTAETNAATQEKNAATYQAQADNASFSIMKEYYQGKADDCLEKAKEYTQTAAEQKAAAAQHLATEQWCASALEIMAGVEPVMTTCTQGKILLESTYYDVAYQSTSDAQYQAALYHNALAVDEGGSASKDGGLKLEKTGYPFVVKAGEYTANGSTFQIEEDVVIASQYHASSLKTRHGMLNAKRISLCAFTLGDQVAFVTVPFEASDRYSVEATLETANNYNDWDNLINNSKWGTPFVMSLTNGAEGYVPNNLAYTYTRDLEARTLAGTVAQPFVSGSYEAHTAYSAAGEGEKIVAALNTLLKNLGSNTAPAAKTGYCAACGETVTWTALNDKTVEDNGMSLATGHYYLAEDYATVYGAALIYLNETVCLDLNGHTYYSNTNTGVSRVFQVYGTLNVMDSVGTGVMKGKMAGNSNGGTVLVADPGVLNLYSGTLTCEDTGTGSVHNGGVVYVGDNATFNMYGGTITGGKVSGTNSYGGNVSIQHGSSSAVGGSFNMYGGTITGGTANSASYANLMISGKSLFRYVGGYIPSGAFMQGTMYLGDQQAYPTDTSQTAVIAVRNSGTVTLDGIFTAKLKLNYSDSDKYPPEPNDGDTIGNATAGSWIDYANGASIIAQTNTGFEAVVDGELLKLGTAPAIEYCGMCQTDVIWLPFAEGVVSGHYRLNSAVTGVGETIIPAGTTLCLELNGNTLTAAGKAFDVYGTLNLQDSQTGGTARGTAVDGTSGGTVYVGKSGTVNQYSGTLTCVQVENAKIKTGGVVYVASGGSYTMHNGMIAGGVTSGSGGNVYNAGTFVMKDGSIFDGTIDNDAMTSYTMGGNVYTTGIFTMEAGSITGGEVEPTSKYALGGNIHAQSGTFTMKGGSITGGNAYIGDNLCTGSNANSTSVFRMEGGYIAAGNYIQDDLILTGTTAGNTAVELTTKKIAENLTIEGVYTGKVNLTINEGADGFDIGSKVGNAVNADISGAQITIVGHENKRVAVVGNELRLAAPQGAVAQVDGIFYDTVEAAVNAYSDPEKPVVLLTDLALGTLNKDIYVDLNGFDVTGVTAGDRRLYVLDSETDDYSVADENYGTVPAGQNIYAADGYLPVTEAGKTSYHKYQLKMSELVVKPSVRGISYKSVFRGDEKVRDQIKEFGVAMRAYNAPNATTIWADPDGKTHVALDNSEWLTGDNDNKLKSVYVEQIISDKQDQEANRVRCAVPVYGRAYIELTDGTMLFSEAKSFSMQGAMEHVDSYWSSLTDKNRTNLLELYNANSDLMAGWNLPNIKAQVEEMTVIPE